MSQIEALEKQLTNATPKNKPAILNKLANLIDRNDPRRSRAYAEQAMTLAMEEGIAREDALARMKIGFTYCVQGNQVAALEWAQQAIELMEVGNFTHEIVGAISNLALVYVEMGEYPKALTTFLQALEKGEAVGNIEGVARVNYNIGYLYESMKEWEKAIAYYQKGIPYWEATNHERLCYTYNGLSEVYLQLGDAVNGQMYAEKSLPLTKEVGDRYNEALAYKHLGEALRQQGQMEAALAAFLQGIEIHESLKADLGTAIHYLAIGNLYLQMQQFAAAAEYMHKALDVSLSINELFEITNCYEALTNLYETQGDFAQALNYYRKYTAVKDELFNEKKQNQLTEMQMRFDSERKEKEAEIYQLKNVALEQEITQRSKAETAALRQSEYYQALLQNIPIAAMTFDLNGRVDSCNIAFETIFGFQEKEILGKPLEQFFASDNSQEVKDNIAFTLTRRPLHMITNRPHANGTLIDVELFAVPVSVSDKQVGVLAMYHDIRERMSVEADLREAKLAAEQATQVKSEFLANMSHEIRTPLNGIIGISGLLLETALNKEQQEYAQIVQASGDSLLTIINEILDFSKIEAGKLELEEQPFDLRQCVEEALDLLSSKAAGKGLELGYSTDIQLPAQFIGDSTRFRQILVNLLGNAVKFTEKGEVMVYVEGDVIENGRYQLHLKVKDTGIGIPPDRMHRLFQPFSQVDSSTTRKFGGSGLGLVISDRLAKLMGGRLWVESEVGSGSTFHFSLVRTAVASKQELYLRTEQPVLTSKRVLIVDDNATNRLILSRQTAAWGMKPTETTSALSALDLLQAGEKFDLALVDMQMPEMSGVDFAHKLRQQRLDNRMPLLLLSSLGQRDATMRDTFVVILTKPIKPSQLYNVLIKTLSEDKNRHNFTDQFQTSAIKPITQSIRILLAEDNRINQKVGLQMLKKLNCKADVAANGLEVLEALARQPYDIVLMDIQMPEMDGVVATQSILQRYGEENRPYIIAMTANALAGDREAYLEAGMDDYLSKPVKMESLSQALQKAATNIVGHGVKPTNMTITM